MVNVFFVSDGTGISVERLGQSLITQFESVDFTPITLPYVNSIEKAEQAAKQIEAAAACATTRPMVFTTILDPKVREIVTKTSSFVLDFFQPFVHAIEKELDIKASGAVGRSHSLRDDEIYAMRIDALNFALDFDDGVSSKGYQEADIILVGVSRTGKTPTCLFLALQYGIKAANYPLTLNDLQQEQIPTALKNFKHKLFGLTIAPNRLQGIRHKRRPNTHYSSLEQCHEEVQLCENLYHRFAVPYLNSTQMSVEELSTHILDSTGIKRRLQA